MVTVRCKNGVFIHCTLSKFRYYLCFPVEQFLLYGESKNAAATFTYRRFCTSVYATYRPYECFLLLRLFQFLLTDIGWKSLAMPDIYVCNVDFIKSFITVLELSCDSDYDMIIEIQVVAAGI